MTALICAIMMNNTKIILDLLSYEGIDVNIKDI